MDAHSSKNDDSENIDTCKECWITAVTAMKNSDLLATGKKWLHLHFHLIAENFLKIFLHDTQPLGMTQVFTLQDQIFRIKSQV